jgi:hypothetical protein
VCAAGEEIEQLAELLLAVEPQPPEPGLEKAI